MTLKELIMQTNFTDVWNALLAAYPSSNDARESYFVVYSKLLEIVPEQDEPLTIEIKRVEECGETWTDIYGTCSTDTVGYAIEFRPWAAWLSYEISEAVLQNYTKEQIIAHCMWEMTFCGYDEETVKKEWDLIQSRVDEFEQMDPTEKAQRTVTWDEVMERFTKSFED